MSNATRQHRWNPANSADTPQEALSRQFTIPGSHYEGPQFCWVWAVAPAGVGFAGKGLGPQYAGDLFVGGSRRFLDNGYLLDFKLNAARDQFAFSDPKLADKVDNNSYKFDIGKGTSFVTGKNFGIATDVETGPDGNLYVVSLSNNAVYMITSKVQTLPPPPAAAPQLVVSPVAITEAPGRKFQGKVATFVDPIAGRAANQFTAVIFWGDGTATSGTVSAGVNGSFVVSSSHRYHRRGTSRVIVAVADPQGESGVSISTASIHRRDRHLRQKVNSSLPHAHRP